jgi:phage shock protein PspC (stress-responsive transcriptional regulator)
MQKVITINLNGNAFQLDEDGYEALRAYLAEASARLGGNPDALELVRDLEQSIAEKCQRHLGPGKSVVTTAEVEQMLREIGPVDSSAGASHAPPPPSAATQPKRLYQIREGAVVSGVANGLAAYFNIDPTIVRVVWVMAAVLEVTRADRPPMLTIGLYVLLMFIVPYAKTSEERAAAQGAAQSLPYKLQHAVERVKATFAGLHHRAH